MKEKFIEGLRTNQTNFGLDLDQSQVEKLADYYELVQNNNALLHLVAPCSEEEFAVRHILESLTLLKYLPQNAKFADVGTGAGLPSIPCLLVREDLHGVLIESKLKKATFLREALNKFELENRAQIINRQFEEIQKPVVSYITCRALDKFTVKLPKLLKWSKNCSLLFFSGNSLRDELLKNRVNFEELLMPMAAQRYLFITKS